MSPSPISGLPPGITPDSIVPGTTGVVGTTPITGKPANALKQQQPPRREVLTPALTSPLAHSETETSLVHFLHHNNIEVGIMLILLQQYLAPLAVHLQTPRRFKRVLRESRKRLRQAAYALGEEGEIYASAARVLEESEALHQQFHFSYHALHRG